MSDAKLRGYLLSQTHPIGRTKAQFFRSLGFGVQEAGQLREALLAVVRANEIAKHIETDFGTKYVIEGMLDGPAKAARVRTVWFADPGSSSPRLVTVYPAK